MKTKQELEYELQDIEKRAKELRSEIDALNYIFNEEVGFRRLTIERDGDGFVIWLINTMDMVSMQCDHDFLVSLNKALTEKL